MQQTTVQNFITELPHSDFMGYMEKRFENLQKKVHDFIDSSKNKLHPSISFSKLQCRQHLSEEV